MTSVWSDTNRFSQTGYSSPTLFPDPRLYEDLSLYLADIHLAVSREQSRREWLEDELAEYRLEEAILRAEAKAERDEWM